MFHAQIGGLPTGKETGNLLELFYPKEGIPM
jgi:hypothetical protein